jgi:hypothetical protein
LFSSEDRGSYLRFPESYRSFDRSFIKMEAKKPHGVGSVLLTPHLLQPCRDVKNEEQLK